MPFIGPIVFAWLTLIMGVMAGYFLLIYRQGRPMDEEPDWSATSPRASRPARQPLAPPWAQPSPRTSRPTSEPLAPAWGQPSRPVAAGPSLPSRPSVSSPALAAYDMEDFPEERWGSPAI